GLADPPAPSGDPAPLDDSAMPPPELAAPPAPAQDGPAQDGGTDGPPPPGVDANTDDATSPAAPQPVTIDNAPPLAPEAAPAEPVDIESVAARRAQRQAERRRWRQPSWSTAFLALIAVNMALIGWRADIVRWLPQTASLYAAVGLPINLRGL